MELRERLQRYGAMTMSTAELISLILSKSRHHDPLAQAHTLLESHDVKWLRNASPQELCQSTHLSLPNAVRLAAACELTRRFALLEHEARVQIQSACDVITLLRPLMAHLDHEEFRVLVLDTKNYVVANQTLYIGTINSSVLRVAEVFHSAIVRKCPTILVAHNHPSGDPAPSNEDRDITTHLVAAGKLLEIDVLDHLIIGNPRFVSLKEQMKW